MRRHAWIAALALALTPGCFTLDFDGDGVIDRPPPSGYEVDELSCSNGRDDDQDGRIDCQDEDCLMRGHCGEQVPLSPDPGPEDRFDFCSDGVDNDGDGQFDCGDRGCQDIRELCCLAEFDDATCSDGIDNDGNGFADCADFSCRNGVFVTVCQLESDCTDRIDNDGDRYIDCRDRDCATDPACGESDCADGIDNDDNGDVDCQDAACAGGPDCPPESNCTNGIDDNGDGRIDCSDPTCAGRSCMENTAALCDDGVDNDDNGYTDCRDFSCEDFCGTGAPEDNAAACMDGVDNDGNGYTDCEDRQCYDDGDNPPTGAAVVYCEEALENTAAECTDGIDNDGNGYTDCDDNNCRFSRNIEARAACEATIASCTDRLDNNRNGFTDCADYSCRFFEGGATGLCGGDGSCPTGQSCFRGNCLQLASPCVEGVDIANERFENLTDVQDEPTLDDRRRMVTAGCTDGLDNDADGFTDCEDWDCNHATARTASGETVPLVVNAAGEPLCRYAGGRTCLVGALAGQGCGSDADCGGAEDSCSAPGPAGQPFVCP